MYTAKMQGCNKLNKKFEFTILYGILVNLGHSSTYDACHQCVAFECSITLYLVFFFMFGSSQV